MSSPNHSRSGRRGNSSSQRGGRGGGRGRGSPFRGGSIAASSPASPSQQQRSSSTPPAPQLQSSSTSASSSSSSTTPSSRSPSTSATRQNAGDLPVFSNRLVEREFRHQHDMRKLLLAALCSADHDGVVVQLATDIGLARLRQIMHSQFDCTAGNSADFYSFQHVAVPLCKLLSEPSLLNSPNASACRRLVGAASSEETFLLQYFELTERLVNGVSPLIERGVGVEAHRWVPTTFLDVIEPLVRLVVLILTRLADEPAQARWPLLLVRLRALAEHRRVQAVRDAQMSRFTDMIRDLARAEQLVERVVRANEARDVARAAFAEKESERVAQEMQLGVAVPLETEPPPGDLRDGGARHDNDFVDFRSIRVLPTADEVMCRIAPYLPLQDVSAPQLASPFVAGAVDRHLDVQFRLLREDMLAPVRRAIQAFVDGCPLTHLPATAPTFAFEGEDADGQRDRVRCALFRNVSLVAIEAEVRDGVCVLLQFDQHVDLLAKNGRASPKKAREQFWQDGIGSRLLQPDSLCVLALHAPRVAPVAPAVVPAAPVLVLATVLPRERNQLGANERHCKLRVRPLGDDLDVAMEHMLVPPRAGCEHVLFQVRGHFYQGFDSVLRALQRQDVARLPFLERIAPRWIVGEQLAADIGLEPRAPGWVTPQTRYDLSCLVRAGVRVPGDLLAVAPDDYEAMCALLARHAGCLVLDETQTRAMALALCREVALIIGPPGTGKSYVGVHIVSVLLKNNAGRLLAPMVATPGGVVAVDANPAVRPHIGPILCICFTNHALDQFLEHLVDSKIVELGGIVRIGGRSRSEKIVGRNLNELSEFSKHEGYRWAKLKERAEKVKADIDEHLKHVKRGAPNEKWLEVDDPDMYEEIMSPYGGGYDEDDNDDSKFEIVGGFPAACNKWQLKSVANQARWRDAVARFVEEKRDQLRALVDLYNRLSDEAREIKDNSQMRALYSASIVAMTTSGAAKYDSLLHALRPRAIICEEAGEVFEAHVLASLTSSAQSLILIGDDKQLRPKPSEYRLSVETDNRHNLDVSMFERLVREGRSEHCVLNTQRRMRPEIAELVRRTLYPTLIDHDSVQHYTAAPRGFVHPVWFLDHQHREASDQGSSSKSNEWEAKMVVALVRYVVRQGYKPHEIAVLTPYVGQLQLLRRLLAKQQIMLFVGEVDLEAMESVDDKDDDDNDADDKSAALLLTDIDAESARFSSESLQRCIRLSTVDNFQGEEAEIVIVSTVRNGGSTGFLSVSNRVNVMLSRAKQGMIVLGSAATIRRSRKSVMMNEVLDMMEELECSGAAIPLRCTQHGTVVEARQAADVSADGGCGVVCGARRQCGHQCKRACHPDDRNHLIDDCRERCVKVLDCGHQCGKLCSDKCSERCDMLVKMRRLRCGHDALLPCGVAHGAIAGWPPCSEILSEPRKMPFCGHARTDVRCGDVSRVRCIAQCGAPLPCGHECRRRCVDCNTGVGAARHGLCEQPCARVLMCGHECGAIGCHPVAECRPCVVQQCAVRCEHSRCPKACNAVCAACAEPCGWRCPHQRCALPCASMCVRPLCDERCQKLLACGHRCPSLCGEPCVSAAYCVECARTHGAASALTRDVVVDIVTGDTLVDVDVEGETSECTLLELRCGHVWTRESLDGVCHIRKFYNADGTVRVDLLLDDDDRVPRCPTDGCKQLVAGARRYSRVLSYFGLVAAQRKWKINVECRAADLRARIAAFDVTVANARAELSFLRQLADELLRDATKHAPTRMVYERECRELTSSPLVKPIAAPELAALDAVLRQKHLFAMYHCPFAATTDRSLAFVTSTTRLMREHYRRLADLAHETRSATRATTSRSFYVGALLDICDALHKAGTALDVRRTLVDTVDAEIALDGEWASANSLLVAEAAKARRALDDPFYLEVTLEEKRAIFSASRTMSAVQSAALAVTGMNVRTVTLTRLVSAEARCRRASVPNAVPL